MDANFRQKNRYRATTYDDVPLSDGWAYFVEKKGYMEHVSKFLSQEEVSFVSSSVLVRYSPSAL